MATYLEAAGTCVLVSGPPPIGQRIHIELVAEHEISLWALDGNERFELGRAHFQPEGGTLTFRPFPGPATPSAALAAINFQRVGEFDAAAKRALRLSSDGSTLENDLRRRQNCAPCVFASRPDPVAILSTSFRSIASPRRTPMSVHAWQTRGVRLRARCLSPPS